MSEQSKAPGREKAAVYQIRAQGALDSGWSDSVGGMDIVIRQEDDGNMTILTGELPDQAALSGVLNLLYDLGLALIEVERLDEPALAKDSDKTSGANLTVT